MRYIFLHIFNLPALLLWLLPFSATKGQENFLALSPEKFQQSAAAGYCYNPSEESHSRTWYLNFYAQLKKTDYSEYTKLLNAYTQSVHKADSFMYMNKAKARYQEWCDINALQNINYPQYLEMNKLQDKNLLRYQNGDIGKADFLAMENFRNQSINDYHRAGDRLQASTQKIRKYTFINKYDLVPSEQEFNLYQIEKNENSYNALALLLPLENNIAILDFLVNNLKKSLFNKEEYTVLLNELKAILKLKTEYAEARKQQLFFEKEYLKENLTAQFVEVKTFEKQQLPESKEILRQAKLRFNTDDIDYFEYLQMFQKAVDLKIKYLQLVDNYNKTALELEKYAY